MGLPLIMDDLGLDQTGEEECRVAAHYGREPAECALHEYIEKRCGERKEEQAQVNRDLYSKYLDVLGRIEAATKSIKDEFKAEHVLLRDQIQRTSNKVVMIVALGTGAAMALTLVKTLLDIYRLTPK